MFDYIPGEYAGGMNFHNFPIEDLKEHVLVVVNGKSLCWCHPEETDVGVWTHNALDQREKYETGELKYH
jgi:hypothetical protein